MQPGKIDLTVDAHGDLILHVFGYSMVFPLIIRDNPQALASGLLSDQVDKPNYNYFTQFIPV